MRIKRLGFIAAACLPLWCATAATASVTLDFSSGVTTGDSTFSQYVQNGFTAFSKDDWLASPMMFYKWTIGGGIVQRGVGSWAASALSITAGNSPFTLQALSAADNTYDSATSCHINPSGPAGVDFEVSGWFAGAQVFGWSPVLRCPELTLASYANPFSSVAIDELRIVAGPLVGTLLDNIILTPVPEPSTALLTGAGLLALGATRRRHTRRIAAR